MHNYKARLVAKGFHQVAGFDFSVTPVVKPTTLRTILTTALSKGWTVRQLNINNAFQNGDLKKEASMGQPPGHLGMQASQRFVWSKTSPKGMVWKASWCTHIFRFCFNKIWSITLYQVHPQVSIYLLVYFNDILITENNPQVIIDLIQRLNQTFTPINLRQINYFLGIRVSSLPNGGLHLSQKKFIIDLLSRAKMQYAKASPMTSGQI